MFEIEMKFALTDPEGLRERLGQLGFVRVSQGVNQDTYYNHPCRDFAVSGEALRVRRDDGVPLVTYKGPKAASAAGVRAVKAREELEWRLNPGDEDGSRMETLLCRLGFRRVATVTKKRETFRLGGEDESLLVTIDEVESLGWYAEIETVLPDPKPSTEAIESARERVRSLADQLHLRELEPRSYLRMHLEKNASAEDVSAGESLG